MSTQLQSLLRDLGYLAAMLSNLDDAWDLWTVPRTETPLISQYTANAIYSDGLRFRHDCSSARNGTFFVRHVPCAWFSQLEVLFERYLRRSHSAQPRLLLLPADVKGLAQKPDVRRNYRFARNP